MHQFPERKKTTLIIPTIKGDLRLELQQATAQESFDYFELIGRLNDWNIIDKYNAIQDVRKYFALIIIKSSDVKRWQFKKKMRIKLVLEDIDECMKYVSSILHPTRNSVYEWYSVPTKVNGKPQRPYLFSGSNESLKEQTGIPTDEVYNRLTLEQVGRYTDASIFKSYETFDEWQSINNQIKSKMWLSEQQKKDLDFIRKNRA